MKTSKEEGMRNMEEGVKNEVEAMRNKEVEARQRGIEGGERWKEKSSLKKAKNYKEYSRKDKPEKNDSSSKTHHLKKGGVNHKGNSSNLCDQHIEK